MVVLLITIIGADFEGLMELARTSLGIVLWRQKEPIADHFSGNPKFWAHYTGSLLMLSMASDQARLLRGGDFRRYVQVIPK